MKTLLSLPTAKKPASGIVVALVIFFLSFSSNIFADSDVYPIAFTGPVTGSNTYCHNSAATLTSGWGFDSCTINPFTGAWYDILTIEWYQNTTRSNTGGTLVQSSGSGSPFAPTSFSSYSPSTAAIGTLYYYVVVTYISGYYGCETSDSIVMDTADMAKVTVTNTPAPDVSNFTVVSATTVCKNSASIVTIVSTTLGNGTFTVTYDLKGAAYVIDNPATLTMNNDTGTFSTSVLTNTGIDTVIVTSVFTGLGCVSYVTTLNRTTFAVNGFSLSASAPANVNCNGGNNGLAVAHAAGGNPPYSYLWSDSHSQTTDTATGLSAGTYTVTVNDLTSTCSQTASVTITQPTPVVTYWWAINNITCYGANNGSATPAVYGGYKPYSYLWSNGNTNGMAKNLSPNVTYTLTVTDKNGCTGSNTVTLTQPASALTETITKNADVSCFRSDNGNATSNPAGGTAPYKYAWEPVSNTSQQSSTLLAGTNKCTVIDANGCVASATVSLTQPAKINATFVKTPPLCYGNNNGTITASPTGGSSTYTAYSWAPYGGSSVTATGVSSRTYTVTITDNIGCTGTSSINLGQPAVITATVTGPSCIGKGGKGTVVGTGGGGTAPYNYTWSNGTSTVGTTGTINLPNGSYTVTISDKYNCQSAQASISFSICPSVLGPDKEGNNNAGLTGITVYPNPTNGQFTVTGIEQGQTVEMYDYTGRKISSQLLITNYSVQINLSSQANGIYLIRILDKDGNMVRQQKVVKTQ